jgi:glycerol-3-phosphate dehydrogenase
MTRPMLDSRRASTLHNLAERPCTQVLIIGGGINGAAVFRDLALQGVDCLLVDKSDWCAGTSAAPSRLIHGGLKYLETGEFRLVAESTRERNLLLRNAPHFVHPLPTIVPIYSYFGGILPAVRRFFHQKAKLTDRGVLIVELGMALYDLFGARHRVMPLHRLAFKRRIRRDFPGLNPSVVATATYYDARVSQAERLCFELIDDGRRAHEGARAINYLAVSGYALGKVKLTDQLTQASFEVQPDVVVNAGGPWIDQVNHALTQRTGYIGGAKGSHLVLDAPDLVAQLKGNMVYFGGSDGRICLVYPFFGHALVGSTDIPFSDPDSVVCDDEETRYMLAMLREVFPGIKIASEQVIYRYSGVRPLPRARPDDEHEVTRDHSLPRDTLADGVLPIFSMVGGKWTTFRAFAEETSKIVLLAIQRERRQSTELERIGGGRDFPDSSAKRAAWFAEFSAKHGVDAAYSEALLDRYGTTADRLAHAHNGAFLDMLTSLPHYSRGEIQAIVRGEQVVTLDDLVFRRTSIATSGLLTFASIEELAEILGDELGWTSDERTRQVDLTLETAKQRHGVRVARPTRAATPSAAPQTSPEVIPKEINA